MIQMKKLIVMGACAMVMALPITAQADTSNFVFTVNSSNYGEDNLSLRTVKDGGSEWENKYYVRPTWFSGSGVAHVRSYMLNNTSVNSQAISLNSSSDRNVLKTTHYNSFAQAGYYYYLQADLVAGSSMSLGGRYTP